MAKYHINAKGDVGACRAKIQCPLGDDRDHYASQAEGKAQAKLAREAKAKAAGIFAEDGGPLKIPGHGSYPEVIKTERSAQIEAVDALTRNRLYEHWDKQGQEYNTEVKTRGEEKINILVNALARKRGQSEDEVLADLQKRADAKWKREYEKNI